MHLTGYPVQARDTVRSAERPLGLVPTMGALHAGHPELVARVRAEPSTVAVSIVVNPLQFRPGEDVDRYPGAFDGDVAAPRVAAAAVVDPDTFDAPGEIRPTALAIASAWLGTTRLIDNEPIVAMRGPGERNDAVSA